MSDQRRGTSGPECDRVREALLKASIRTLRGDDGSRLSEHLDSCDACAAVVVEILADHERLDSALDALTPSPDAVEAVLTAVHAEAAEQGAPRVLHLRTKPAARVLAAAAVLAAIALWAGRNDGTKPVPPAELATSTTLTVDASAGAGLAVEAESRFALMKTEQPAISVVWFY